MVLVVADAVLVKTAVPLESVAVTKLVELALE